MSPFLICLSPPDRQIRQTNGRIRRTDGRTGRMDWSNGQTDGLIGWTGELDGQTDKLNKRTHRWKVDRTCARTNGQTDWAECTNGLDGLDTRRTNGREGPDRLDLTDGQYGRTGWTDGGADRLDGQTDWIYGLDKRLDWTDGRTKGRTEKLD